MKRAERLADQYAKIGRVEVIQTIQARGQSFPIHAFHIGATDPTLPVLGLVGGIHGLEKVGTHLLLSYLESFAEQYRWDEDLRERMKSCRLLVVPMVNPAGVRFDTRSNANGVDLMRNAPIDSGKGPPFLLGGHRFSRRLPWYRGIEGAPMEAESQALCDFVRREMFPSRALLVVDIHSGFGMGDRLWYPYARSADPFPRLHQVERLAEILNRSFPNHIYMVEPQSLSYTTHGDLWDYLFDEHLAKVGPSGPVFIPWTLEMGSWIWVRKNPLQAFSALGPFNPVKAHRLKRTMRRHLPLLDFFLRAIKNHGAWAL